MDGKVENNISATLNCVYFYCVFSSSTPSVLKMNKSGEEVLTTRAVINTTESTNTHCFIF